VSQPYERKTTGKQRNTARKCGKHAKWQQQDELRDRQEHEKQSHEHKPHIRSTKTTNTPIKTPHHKGETQQEDHQTTPWAQKAASSRTLG
jgi:hypothetical protein